MQWADLDKIGVDSDDDDEAEAAMEELTSTGVARYGRAALDAAMSEVGAERHAETYPSDA